VKWSASANVFAAWSVWRATGSASAGARLAQALAVDDETARTAAGMLLVRAGARALPLLRHNLAHGIAVPMSLRVIGDLAGEVGREAALALIAPYREHADARIARAALEAAQAAEQAARETPQAKPPK
jgi:hypothetical protein